MLLYVLNIPHTPKILHLLTLIQTMHRICDSSMPLYRQRMSLYWINIVLLVQLFLRLITTFLTLHCIIIIYDDRVVSCCQCVCLFGHWVCGESWHAIKGSRPSSQGWAPGVLPLCVCVCVWWFVYFFVFGHVWWFGGKEGGGSGFFLFFLLLLSFIASKLCVFFTPIPICVIST